MTPAPVASTRPGAGVARPIVDIRVRRTGCSSTGEFAAGATASVQDAQPGHRGAAGRGRRRPARPTWTARCAAARARLRASLGPRCRAPSGPSTCTGSPGIIQERPASSRCWRALDNGKPIRESRDVDIPLAAAHFFYYAGWADKLEYAGFGPDPRPLGVAGQVIPWNFPLLMAAWKLAPALAAGNTCVLKPAETTPADRAAARRDLPAGRPAAGRGEHADRRRARPGRALVAHPGVDKVAFTGSTEVGKADRPGGRRHRQEADPGTRRQGREHRVRRRAARPGGRGHRQRHLLQPGPRLLRRVAAAGAGVGRRRRCLTGSSAGWPRCGSATRWTRTPTSARSTRPSSSARSASCPTPARPRARSAGRRRASCPTAGSGSRRRSSPGSASRTGSPGRRSSARCCRC